MTTGRFASHVHSEWSDDASWTLADIRTAFRRRGYDGVLLCEHDRGFSGQDWDAYREECARLSDERFLLVPGIEYGDRENCVHIPVWGSVPFFGEGRDPGEVLQLASDHNGAAVLAHPWRRAAHERFDPTWAKHLVGVEIWNRKYDGVAPDRRAVALAGEHDLSGFVSLDFHTARQFYPLATRIYVEGRLSPEAVHRSLLEGRWRPQFLRMSALRFTAGAPGAVLEALEVSRQAVRRAARIR